MTGVEDQPHGVESQPKEKPSQLATLRNKLIKLADEGKIYYIGEVGPDDKTQKIPSLPIEHVNIYVGLVDPLFPAMASKSRQLMEKSKELARQIEMGKGVEKRPEDDTECGLLTLSEQIAEKNVQPDVNILVDDMSVAMRENIGVTKPVRKIGIMRYIDVKVYEDKETAELEYGHDKGVVNHKDYIRIKRRKRYPRITEVFDSVTRRKPHQPQK